MPFANSILISKQVRILETENVDIVIPLMPSGFEPLHAVYRQKTCLAEVAWALDNDQWKLISWFPKVKVHTLSPEECRLSDPRGLAFSNVNTPQDLAEAEALAQQES